MKLIRSVITTVASCLIIPLSLAQHGVFDGANDIGERPKTGSRVVVSPTEYRITGGGAEERLTSAGAYDDVPNYSTDGKWTYFNSNRRGGWDIWRIPAFGGVDGEELAQRVTSDEWEERFPHPSPNGRLMALISFPKGTEGHNGRMDGMALRLMKMPGRNPTAKKIETLTTFFGGQGSFNVNSWSPDSKLFGYVIDELVSPQEGAQ